MLCALAPGPPTNVNVTERDGDIIFVSWSPPTMPNGIITGEYLEVFHII